MPTLLTSEADLGEQVQERLEVHFLSGAGGITTFALLWTAATPIAKSCQGTRRY